VTDNLIKHAAGSAHVWRWLLPQPTIRGSVSTPIKPTGLEPTTPTDVSEVASDPSTQAPASTQAPQAASATSEAGPTDALSEIARALAEGSVNSEEAVSQLIDRALESMAGHLDPTARAELALVLREAIDNDPGLRALRDDLE
jgi:hypothetical protein